MFLTSSRVIVKLEPRTSPISPSVYILLSLLRSRRKIHFETNSRFDVTEFSSVKSGTGSEIDRNRKEKEKKESAKNRSKKPPSVHSLEFHGEGGRVKFTHSHARRPSDRLMDPIAFSLLVNFIVSAVVGQCRRQRAEKRALNSQKGRGYRTWWRWGGRVAGWRGSCN